MIDFPASPTVGQNFAAPNGVTYQWNGTVWFALSPSGAGVFLPLAGGTLTGPLTGTTATFSGVVKCGIAVGATPPAAPVDGQLWYNNDGVVEGCKLFISYNDGDTTQWVPVA